MKGRSIVSDYLYSQSFDIFSKIHDFAKFVSEARSKGDDVYFMPVLEYRGSRALVDGGKQYGKREIVVMCSTDYLGLAHHPDIIDSGVKALREFGTNVASVPLFGGSTFIHKKFEKSLSDFIGVEACVLFPTGYAANLGTIQALCSQNDVVVLDKLCHYSVLDGVRLSGAARKSFRHSDPDHLEQVLSVIREENTTGGVLVVLEGVYGIDGDLTPLTDLTAVAEKYSARIMIDDAHATGVVGADGKGTAQHYNMKKAPDIITGSLSKALASPGGFVVCSSEASDYLRTFARTVTFSVGLQAACVACADAALDFIRNNPWLIAKLQENASYFRNALVRIGLQNPSRSKSAIMSVIVGKEEILRNISRELFQNGVWAEALPFPAVPIGEERIRFRVSATHSREDLDFVLGVVEKTFSKYGLL
jgi:glycine C-acetyltransferase